LQIQCIFDRITPDWREESGFFTGLVMIIILKIFAILLLLNILQFVELAVMIIVSMPVMMFLNTGDGKKPAIHLNKVERILFADSLWSLFYRISLFFLLITLFFIPQLFDSSLRIAGLLLVMRIISFVLSSSSNHGPDREEKKSEDIYLPEEETADYGPAKHKTKDQKVTKFPSRKMLNNPASSSFMFICSPLLNIFTGINHLAEEIMEIIKGKR
jgi:hypothetical protein